MSDGDCEWESVEPFGIDNGELDGLSPQEVFVLGYELAAIAGAMERNPDRQQFLIHTENRERISRFAENRGRICQITWIPNDISESWMTAIVEARDP